MNSILKRTIGYGVMLWMLWCSPSIANTIWLQGAGTGNSVTQAKEQAVADLSQQIRSEVKTRIKHREIVNELGRQVSLDKQIHIQADFDFVGLLFETNGLGNGQVQAKAYLNTDAILQTLDGYASRYQFNLLSVQAHQLPAIEKALDQHRALVNGLPSRFATSGLTDPKYQQWWRDLDSHWQTAAANLMLRKTQAIITFISDRPLQQVKVDGVVRDFEPYLTLDAGKYQVAIIAKDGRQTKVQLNVRAGQIERQRVWWLPATATRVTVDIDPQLRFISTAAIAQVLKTQHIGLGETSDIRLGIEQLQRQKTSVNGVNQYQVQLRLAFWQGRTRLKQLRTQLNVTLAPTANEKALLEQHILQRIQMVLRPLVSATF